MRFRTKLMLWISVVLALSLGISGTAIITSSFASSIQTRQRTAVESQKDLHQMLGLLVMADYENSGYLQKQIPNLIQNQTIPVRIHMDQALLYENRTECLPPPEKKMEDGTCLIQMRNDSFGHGLVIQSAAEYGGICYEIQMRQDLSDLYQSRAQQIRMFLWIYLTVLGTGLAGGLVISRHLTKPLGTLQQTVRQITGGNLSLRTQLCTRDEFEELSRDFDAMTDHLEQNLRDLEQQMEKQKSFMGAFSHELKTPMTAMIGYADLLRQDALSAENRMQAANYIFSEGKRLERLSQKLLQLLQIEKDPVLFQQADLQSLMEEVQQSIRPKLRSVSLSVPAETANVWLEPELTKSLLLNLLDNARKAVGPDGTIRLTARPVPGGCRFSVTDNGRGMEAAELKRITEPFYRVDKSRSRLQGGAGLGLALCQQIVRLHHGRMQFDSTPGMGTTVTVTLYGKGDLQ